MKQKISTFLTFQDNNAEQAMNFYVALFKQAKVIDIQRYGKAGPGAEGSIMIATFELNGAPFICSDSFIQHDWDFTPAVSIWVECESALEISTLFEQLSTNGEIKMPLDHYGFSSNFCFIEDQFGVSWQLNLK